ncbi:MAG: alpha-hydroxy-acid oxidizing protein [bacterium]|nr:alpha-hydroxy-acid oxidizing protein [bacterium]
MNTTKYNERNILLVDAPTTCQHILENARNHIGPYCKSCTICNGRACKNAIPGPGSKGNETVFIRNYQKWTEILVNMDTIHENKTVDTSCKLFGQEFSLPVFAAPIGSLQLHYGDKYNDTEYDEIIVPSCVDAGIAAFVGDGPDASVMEGAAKVIKEHLGKGIPTIKPWNMELIFKKLELVKKADPIAIAMDIDAAGLPFLKNQTPPAGSKTVEELRQIIEWAEKPFIVKGIMTAKAAKKAMDAGASAIVVSNHGGRVLDQCPATAEVLSEIVETVGGKMKIFVDGGIRTGVDVLKALAMGADGVLIGRPFVNMVYGGDSEGVRLFVDKLQNELADTMAMCGAFTLEDINRHMIRMTF